MKIIKVILFPIVLIYRAYKQFLLGKRFNKWESFVLGGEILVKMKRPNAKFFINPRSRLMHSVINGVHEEVIFNFIEKLNLKQGLIVNIGSNIGFYTIHFAQKFPNHKILAIEPNPEVFPLLIKNIEINGLTQRIKTLNACISDNHVKQRLAYIPGKSEFSSINNIVHDYSKNETVYFTEIENYTLDELINDEKVALIFIDVEGAERMVLSGSLSILTNSKPIIIMECSDLLLSKFGENAKTIINLLRENDYSVMDIQNKSRYIKFPFNGNIFAENIGTSR